MHYNLISNASIINSLVRVSNLDFTYIDFTMEITFKDWLKLLNTIIKIIIKQ